MQVALPASAHPKSTRARRVRAGRVRPRAPHARRGVRGGQTRARIRGAREATRCRRRRLRGRRGTRLRAGRPRGAAGVRGAADARGGGVVGRVPSNEDEGWIRRRAREDRAMRVRRPRRARRPRPLATVGTTTARMTRTADDRRRLSRRGPRDDLGPPVSTPLSARLLSKPYLNPTQTLPKPSMLTHNSRRNPWNDALAPVSPPLEGVLTRRSARDRCRWTRPRRSLYGAVVTRESCTHPRTRE